MNSNGQKPKIWTDTFLDQQRLLGDPEADDVIKELLILRGHAAARQLFDRLIGEIELPVTDLPDTLQAFISKHGELKGVTHKQIAAAQELFEDHGAKFIFILYFKSLPVVYSCANLARVLAKTGRLTHDEESTKIFTRRIAETGRFLIDTMTKGGLRPGAQGIQSIIKVRLIHAVIRAFIKQGGWNTKELGEPINQEDMALTLLTFSLSSIEGLQKFGLQEPLERKESYFATWRAIGLLLGVRQELIPDNLQQARILMDKILLRQANSSDEGKLLAKALVEFTNKAVKSEELKNVPELMIRFLAGERIAEQLGIIKTRSWFGIILLLLMRWLFNYIERLEDASEPVHLIMDRVSGKIVLHMIDYFKQHKGAAFKVPEHLHQV